MKSVNSLVKPRVLTLEHLGWKPLVNLKGSAYNSKGDIDEEVEPREVDGAAKELPRVGVACHVQGFQVAELTKQYLQQEV